VTAVATVGQRQAGGAALDADTVTDRMEKTATRLSSDDADAINEALHVDFETFVIDPDSGEITPMWRPPETEFDLGAALRRYQESEAGAGSKYTVPCSCGIRA
jgi:hypothetical protein